MTEQLTEEQKAAIEQQKANCPFCKIVKGEIPSTKIYEDDSVLAIADINPATKGHILLLPKEHYPILPIVPPQVSSHMFMVARDLSRAQKKAVVTDATNIVIANGAAAGQQSPHFLFHVLAREKGDKITDVFSLPIKEQPAEQQQQIAQALQHNLSIALGNKFGTAPPPAPVSNPTPERQPVVGEEQKAKLADAIRNDSELQEALTNDLEKAKEIISLDAQLQELTRGVDLDALHLKLKQAQGGVQ